jgi:hypothetical protein
MESNGVERISGLGMDSGVSSAIATGSLAISGVCVQALSSS